MLSRLGDESFRVGNVEDNTYQEIMNNPILKTMCVASCLDNHAGCADCVYKPYCGVCPLVHYMEYGTIFPQISATDQCKIKIAMFDYLFSKITTPKMKVIFERWLERPALFQ